MARKFSELTEREILALAISIEEEHSRIYGDFADGLRENYPDTATIFDEMREEESDHRGQLIERFKIRFGDHIPLIRRQDVQGFSIPKPIWLMRPLPIAEARKQASMMEVEARRFYERALNYTTDANTRKLLGDLIEAERQHVAAADEKQKQVVEQAGEKEDVAERRLFVLQVVQPGLAGLMDGSVSTLAPIFAAAFATHSSWDAFIVGMAASIGAGISMAFAEALSDDGSLTGRGRPYLRGAVTGVMTMAGGIGHTLPFLIKDFNIAFIAAMIVVVLELGAIAWIRNKYMDTPILSAIFQVVVGGVLVLAAGILIGSS